MERRVGLSIDFVASAIDVQHDLIQFRLAHRHQWRPVPPPGFRG
jgi:hypothetical protein